MKKPATVMVLSPNFSADFVQEWRSAVFRYFALVVFCQGKAFPGYGDVGDDNPIVFYHYYVETFSLATVINRARFHSHIKLGFDSDVFENLYPIVSIYSGVLSCRATWRTWESDSTLSHPLRQRLFSAGTYGRPAAGHILHLSLTARMKCLAVHNEGGLYTQLDKHW